MDDATYKRWRAKTQRREDGCLIWTGALNGNGYGVLRADDKKQYAHRLAYEHFVGPIPKGREIDHLCRVRACVDWQHLEAVTRAENARRSPIAGAVMVAGMAARQRAKTHCPAGHAYDEANTHRDPRGGRHCRACHRECDRARRYRAKQHKQEAA